MMDTAPTAAIVHNWYSHRVHICENGNTVATCSDRHAMQVMERIHEELGGGAWDFDELERLTAIALLAETRSAH